MNSIKDARHLYTAERQAYHLERPGFRINELTLTPSQEVPWHCHNTVRDTFYVLEGRLRIFLRDPEEEAQLDPGDSHAVEPGRPHRVTNGADAPVTFLVLQGIGEYDYAPLA